MKNKESLLLIVIMIVTASLAAFLYSPVVTKNDFGSDGFALNPGVAYGGKVVNAVKRDNSFSIPDRSMPIFTTEASNYKTNAGNSFSEASTGSSFNSSYSISNAKNKNGNKSSSMSSGFAGMSQSGGGAIYSQSRSNQADNQGMLAQNMAGITPAVSEIPSLPSANFKSKATESNGFTALVTNITTNLTNENVGMQKTFDITHLNLLRPDIEGGTVIQYKTTDISSLPIPDGTYFLLVLTVGYLIVKRRWVPKSKRVVPPAVKEEYQLNFSTLP